MKKRKKLLVVSLLLGGVLASAQTTVTGTVTDKKGNPVPGAKVELAGTEESVLTDLDGSFSLTQPQGDAATSVNVYYVGMRPKSQTIRPDMHIELTKTTWWNRKPDHWQFFGEVQGAFPESGGKNAAYGVRLGVMKDYGVYVKALFGATPSTDHEWDDFTGLKPWTTGKYKNGMQAYLVGGMVRLGCAIYLNLGLGYMNSTVAWQLSDESWTKYNDDSYSGVCFETGLTLRAGNHFLLSGGLLMGSSCARAPYLGLGYCF